jgi:hypothetical protein
VRSRILLEREDPWVGNWLVAGLAPLLLGAIAFYAAYRGFAPPVARPAGLGPDDRPASGALTREAGITFGMNFLPGERCA